MLGEGEYLRVEDSLSAMTPLRSQTLTLWISVSCLCEIYAKGDTNDWLSDL